MTKKKGIEKGRGTSGRHIKYKTQKGTFKPLGNNRESLHPTRVYCIIDYGIYKAI